MIINPEDTLKLIGVVVALAVLIVVSVIILKGGKTKYDENGDIVKDDDDGPYREGV